jgi:UPF0042 nucleotide-binding protein
MPLVLRVRSFSFKYDPAPSTRAAEHGGGFVFDCRLLSNPGREPELKSFTGRDQAVREYLQKLPQASEFLAHCEQLVVMSIERYLERGFEQLQVEFGCTGGQHRSVYCAEEFAARMQQRYAGKVKLQLEHVGLQRMGYS